MRIFVSVKPRAGEERVEKAENEYVVYVKEAPVENKANIALIRLLAKYFGVPKYRIAILSGMRSRRKIIEIKDFSG